MIRTDWKIPYSRPYIADELIKAGYNPLLSAILSLRGVKDRVTAEGIVGDTVCTHDPFLLKGMAEAVKRIKIAIAKKEHIAVYGDYDVDGITSTCLLSDFFGSLGIECTPYIPDRSEEGYGLNCKALAYLKSTGVSLVISVDCGITAVNEAVYARQAGIDLIITDHHECKDGALPDAVTVIDPKQDGDNYPNSALAGVGVALKLACACSENAEEVIESYVDLVAVGTVADVMPLVGENRYFVKKGLKKLAECPRPGIAAIFRESAIDITKLNSTTIGFSLAPRLNAAGRLGQAVTATELLMSHDNDKATKLALELCELNRKRQNIENSIWEEAKGLIYPDVPKTPIVLASEKWHQGVIGIAASRLAEHYSLPTIMVCLNGDVGKGSCRSYGGFNLFEALNACSEHLIGFGGHALAAGLNISRAKLEDFKAALAKYYLENKPVPQPSVDCDLLIVDPLVLSKDNVRSLELLEPYGNGNPKPTLCFSGAKIESCSNVGNGKHLRIKVSIKGEVFDGIFFSHTAEELELRPEQLVDIAFFPQINSYRGHESVQLIVSGLRHHYALELCESILENDSSVAYAASAYCPCRNDFVRVWKYIRSFGADFSTGADACSVLSQCPAELSYEQWCICLMVFLEVGLLRSADSSIYNASTAEIAGKADLEATKLIKALRSV